MHFSWCQEGIIGERIAGGTGLREGLPIENVVTAERGHVHGDMRGITPLPHVLHTSTHGVVTSVILLNCLR